MSYDLYFTSPKISLDEFNRYFGDNSYYEVENGQAFYSNDNTGVYFSFEHNSDPIQDEDDIEHSVAFNINYYRPHFFALEAEPEINRFIDHFNCSIHDYQNEGMAIGPYSKEGFLKGWNHGNEFGYSAILGNDDAPEIVFSKPTKEIEEIWNWNFSKEMKDIEIDEDIFIPRIMYIVVDGVLGSACVWPDGISTLIPYVDFLYVPRKDLAPKRIFKKKEEDYCIIPRNNFPDFLNHYVTNEFELKSFKLPSPETPKMIKDYVRKLKPFKGKVEGVGLDSVLNSEIVEKYKKGQQ